MVRVAVTCAFTAMTRSVDQGNLSGQDAAIQNRRSASWPMSGVYAIVPYCLASLRESREISLSVLSSEASDHRVPLVTGINGTLMARQS